MKVTAHEEDGYRQVPHKQVVEAQAPEHSVKAQRVVAARRLLHVVDEEMDRWPDALERVVYQHRVWQRQGWAEVAAHVGVSELAACTTYYHFVVRFARVLYARVNADPVLREHFATVMQSEEAFYGSVRRLFKVVMKARAEEAVTEA